MIGFAAVKMIRRILGFAHVIDFSKSPIQTGGPRANERRSSSRERCSRNPSASERSPISPLTPARGQVLCRSDELGRRKRLKS